MAGGYDTLGNYSRWYSWVADDIAQVGIVSDRHDKEDDEFAKGLNLAFLRDGRAPATADWNMAGHIIHNLGTATTPADGDAVSYGMLTGSGGVGSPAFKKGITISGAGVAPNYLYGAVNFSSLTGANGLSWAGASMALLARVNEASKTRDRLVLNNNQNGTGGDVIIFDDAGNINLAALHYNLSYDTAGNFRAISPGWVGRAAWDSAGSLHLQNINAATTVDPYVAVTLKDRISFTTYNGFAFINLTKDMAPGGGNANAYCGINAYNGVGSIRWQLLLGNGTVEDSSSHGSDFYLYGYKNDGTAFIPIYVTRNDGKLHLGQIASGITIDGDINSPASSLLLGGVTGVYLRPNGIGSTSGQFVVSGAGDASMIGEFTTSGAGNGVTAGIGLKSRSGSSGSYGSNRGNIWWSGSAGYVYIDSTAFPLTAPCDYRIKDQVKPLSSTWDKVKALRPVSFTYRDHDIIKADGVEQWGFLAHELQESLLPSAATGAKDDVVDVTETTVDDDGVASTRVVGTQPQLQGPNPLAIIAALTAALQEAQLRIEALEARLAA